MNINVKWCQLRLGEKWSEYNETVICMVTSQTLPCDSCISV